MRAPDELAAPEAVGRYAAERALSRLASRKIKTCQVPVLFESSLAAGLLGSYVQATSGGALYRKSSFLQDSLGREVLATHIDVHEDPHLPRGKGSAPFDDEGVVTRARDVVREGVVQGYFLSTYSARKLGMRTTGHSGGSHNLIVTSRATQPGDDLEAMLRKLHRGFFVIELMGQGVNPVTGDYSRGAAGFWVEGGRIGGCLRGGRPCGQTGQQTGQAGEQMSRHAGASAPNRAASRSGGHFGADSAPAAGRDTGARLHAERGARRHLLGPGAGI